MGCGASAPSAAVPEKGPSEENHLGRPKKRHQKGLHAAEETAVAHADAAAATVVAGAAATIVSGVVSSDARHAYRDVAGAAGLALLDLGKELPWVAPLAFLIAGVVKVRHQMVVSRET